MRNIQFISLGTHLFAYDRDVDSLFIFSAKRRDWVEYPGVPAPNVIADSSIPDDVLDPTPTTQPTAEPAAKPDDSGKRRKRVAYTEDFNQFWGRYRYHCMNSRNPDGDMPAPGAKFKAFEIWRKLSPQEQRLGYMTLEEWFRQTDYPCHGERYLKYRRWEDVDTDTAPAPHLNQIELARQYLDRHGYEETARRFGLEPVGTDDLLGLMISSDTIMSKVANANAD